MPEKTATLTLVRLCLGDLKQHPRNPRKHPEPGTPQWEVLKASLERDYFDPLVVNQRNNTLVSGHFRHKVLIELGYTHADVSVVDYDEPTHLARLIAANQLLGEWEKDVLTALARDISAAGIEAALAGWDEKQMASRLDGPGVADDTELADVLVSKADALQKEWKVQPGDLYQIGPVRLFCGDCTLEKTWSVLLEGKTLDLVWTDPPYNVDYQGTAGGMLNDSMSDEHYAVFLRTAFLRSLEVTKPGGAIYVAHADSEGRIVRAAFHQAGWHAAQCLIWVKNAFTLGRQDHQWQHEPILYGWKPGAAHYWQGGFSQASVIDDEEKGLTKLKPKELIEIIQRLRNARDTSVVREARNAENALHPTIKPLPLVARQIHNSSRAGEMVGDSFGGSGTTLVAAAKLGRRAVAPELAPNFCAVILQRLKEHGHNAEKLEYAAA